MGYGISYFGLEDLGRKAGNLWDDVTGVTAAEGVAESQRNALSEATESQEKMFDKSLATQQPWLEAGGRGLANLEAGLDTGRFASEPGSFEYGDYEGPDAFQNMKFDFEADPGYQFRLEQGLNAREGSAAAKGGLFSGATGRSLEDYSQGLASQEYANAYNRFANDRNFNRGMYESDRAFDRGIYDADRGFSYGQFSDDFNRDRALKTDDYNRLASLAGVGQVTAGNVANQQMAQGGNLANLSLQKGNIGAQRSMAGYQGGMNLFNTGLQGLSAISGMMNNSGKQAAMGGA